MSDRPTYLAKMAVDLRNAASRVLDGSASYAEARCELLERAAFEIEGLLQDENMRHDALEPAA